MPSLFTRIIEGDLPATFVWRDEVVVAFMSINPLKPGHTLVVPRDEVEHWLDLPGDVRRHMFDVSQVIGRAIQQVWEPAKVGLMLAGLEVAHTHVHVSPIWSPADLEFGNAAESVSREELEESAARIREALRAQGGAGVAG